MNELTLILRTEDSRPLYEQIYHYIKNEIVNGHLEKGSRLPSTRSLSAHLSVSRSTVQLAYDQLLSEGYIESVPCRGYYINDLEGLYQIPSPVPAAHTPQEPPQASYPFDFSPSGIDLDSFPYNTWRKVTKNVLIDDNRELFNIGHPQGEPDFRKTIAGYLHQSRGVICHPGQIVLGAGNEYLLMILHQLLGPDATFAMENPTYAKACKTLQSLEHTIFPIAMDRHGMHITGLKKSGADVAYVTPSHQYPLGIVMPVKRRSELLAWATDKPGRYIIEDDYDSEFRYKGRPIPALQGSDTHEKVIYLGTFSKSIAPAIRMSYMVLPPALLSKYQEKCRFLSCTVSRLDQTVVNTFILEGCYERHLNKMRASYKTRHDLLLEQLKPFSKEFEISGENAGLHILLTARGSRTEEELVLAAHRHGVQVYPLSQYYIEPPPIPARATILLGYANLSPQAITGGIAQLKTAWAI